jgi:hypothetical protein
LQARKQEQCHPMSTGALDQAIPVRSGSDFAAQSRNIFGALRPA